MTKKKKKQKQYVVISEAFLEEVASGMVGNSCFCVGSSERCLEFIRDGNDASDVDDIEMFRVYELGDEQQVTIDKQIEVTVHIDKLQK